jgi:cytochrome c553
MRRIVLLALLLGFPGFAAAQSTGAEIAEHGNDKGALPCAACHGEAGQGNTAIGAPALAGLPQAVIVSKLQAFAAGQGGNAMMQRIARSLSPDERVAVADYFNRLK